MKWSLQQLFKYNGKPFTFNFTCDLKKYIENISDILDISEVSVSGVGQNVRDERYVFDLNISCTLTLEDAVTLDAVEYPLNISTTEVFDFIDDEDDVNLIDKNTINLEGVVWENILVLKPIRYTKSDNE